LSHEREELSHLLEEFLVRKGNVPKVCHSLICAAHLRGRGGHDFGVHTEDSVAVPFPIRGLAPVRSARIDDKKTVRRHA
jgi:hypothetical protein